MKHSSKIRFIVFTTMLFIVSILCLCNTNLGKDYTEEVTTETKAVKETQQIETETVLETITLKVNTDKPKRKYEWRCGDDYLLAKIAMAEAEGESIEGKALVMLVVLNRVESDEFPDTVEEVIFQNNNGVYQFSPLGNGRFYNVSPNDDCWKAWEMVNSGWNESKGALYFTSSKEKSTWHSRNLSYLFDEGNHKFYK